MIDAAAALAGLGGPLEPCPPAALARAFCGGSRRESDGSTVYAGHAPYDDGYTALADLVNRGWLALPTLGDWPLVVYLAWPRNAEPALLELIEGDLTVRVFPTRTARGAHAAGSGARSPLRSRRRGVAAPDCSVLALRSRLRLLASGACAEPE